MDDTEWKNEHVRNVNVVTVASIVASIHFLFSSYHEFSYRNCVCVSQILLTGCSDSCHGFVVLRTIPAWGTSCAPGS